MSRRTLRLGVALLLDPPLADEVAGLRRALRDPALGRVPPHVTLVPPVNVRPEHLSGALAALRSAAAALPGPLQLTLGPVSTFLPDNPVVYLAVGGDLEALRRLRDRVFTPPLARSLTWPWVPHVTLADGAPPERISAALAALDGFVAVAGVDRVVLLREVADRAWLPLADAALGPAVVVGRGGLALALAFGRLVDPEAEELLAGGPEAEAVPAGGAGPAQPDSEGAERGPNGYDVVVTARREGAVVGVGRAWRTEAGGQVAVAVAHGARRQGVGSAVLAQLEAALRRAGWRQSPFGHGPTAFYRSRSGWVYSNSTCE